MSVVLAYFDPGSGSLLLQMLVGGSAGLIVFAKYLWETGPSMLLRSNRGLESGAEQLAPSGTNLE